VKAFLLAAGLGTRLRPITDTTPKCMVRIGGRPLLDLWLDSMRAAGVDEVLVNMHHLADLVRAHLDERTGPPAVHVSYEPVLLGSAGTLLANRSWIAEEEFFLACNADNLTDFDLGSLIDTHRGYRSAATLTVFRAENPSACGIVELDAGGVITEFTEKPSHPVSDLANAGIYAFTPGVLDEINGATPCDVGHDLLPKLAGRARAVELKGYFRDIGTIDAYRRALQEWPARTEAMTT
jgi:mannose-1-phosphate guanylyltransferase